MIHRLVQHARWRLDQRERDRRHAGRKGYIPMPDQPFLTAVIHHASEIRKLPDDTREFVADALRVRAMDFVEQRLQTSGATADMAADVVRALVPNADAQDAFDPEAYA